MSGKDEKRKRKANKTSSDKTSSSPFQQLINNWIEVEVETMKPKTNDFTPLSWNNQDLRRLEVKVRVKWESGLVN